MIIRVLASALSHLRPALRLADPARRECQKSGVGGDQLETMSQVTGVTWTGEVKMTTLEAEGGEFKDPGEAMPAGVAGELSGGGSPGRGLVLPDEVVADLAGQLVARARAGEPVRLTGQGGLLAGVIGQVLQAGLALE